MPLSVKIDLGRRPKLSAHELLEIVREGLGDRYEVYAPGRFQAPDVMVKQSDDVGVAIQVLEPWFRKTQRLRVYGLAPSIAHRGSTPIGLQMQKRRSEPLLEEVVAFLRGSDLIGERASRVPKT